MLRRRRHDRLELNQQGREWHWTHLGGDSEPAAASHRGAGASELPGGTWPVQPHLYDLFAVERKCHPDNGETTLA